jgi:hypothetical protein
MNDKITVTDYFGGCPKCGGSDGLYNVGRANWFVCHTHKVRWTVGSNILSSWRYETEDEQRERWEVVADYEDIEDGSLPEGVWSRDPVARNKELEWVRPSRGLRRPPQDHMYEGRRHPGRRIAVLSGIGGAGHA